MKIKLTPRLQCLADQVPKGAKLADIGTDHAYLPIYLLQQDRINHALACDLRVGPLDSARNNAIDAGLCERVTLRLAAGLRKVAPEECDTITIAGMGGETIVQILQEAIWTARGDHLILLQPMTMLPQLRQYLLANGYYILREIICTEGRRRYIVMCVRGGAARLQTVPPLTDCTFSDALLHDTGAKKYLQALLQRETNALTGMRRAEIYDITQVAEQEKLVEKLKKTLEELP